MYWSNISGKNKWIEYVGDRCILWFIYFLILRLCCNVSLKYFNVKLCIYVYFWQLLSNSEQLYLRQMSRIQPTFGTIIIVAIKIFIAVYFRFSCHWWNVTFNQIPLSFVVFCEISVTTGRVLFLILLEWNRQKLWINVWWHI